MKKSLYFVFTLLLLNSCSKPKETVSLNTIAEDYVKLILEIGLYDSDFVDAYYGPDEWKPTIKKLDTLPAKTLIESISKLQSQCKQVNTEGFSNLEKARLMMFEKQLLAAKTKLEIMSGKVYSFDEEAKLIYDAEPPHFTEAHFETLLSKLNTILPGEESLYTRYNEFISQFVIPKEKLDTVFTTAIAEARTRTNKYIKLPKNENFVLEYVNDKSWSGYNYYQGKSQSLIQINTDMPIYIERAVDLACHEGYPGHHVFNALLEQNLVEDKGWVEFSVYPLFSPQSLIAEGSANYGIDVAFPGQERIDFEKNVLFPLAGLDINKAETYYEVLALMGKLNYAGNEAARKYLNGEITREECAKWLEKYSLNTPERALQRTRFFDQYRSYVINYNLGKDLVADYIDAQGGTVEHPEKRWEIFKELLSNPHTANSLK
ncbi:hypothetical protein [Pontimicrobium sp. IMCC45349]|uniref:hypothetical protein n=1 Tax=Pontimicrobium sp. IMCC45349 TaxID=3391574 RepID=UPI0039A07E08